MRARLPRVGARVRLLDLDQLEAFEERWLDVIHVVAPSRPSDEGKARTICGELRFAYDVRLARGVANCLGCVADADA